MQNRLMFLKLGAVLLILALFGLFYSTTPINTPSDVVRYIDHNGVAHYVDSHDKVPQEYRRQLIGAKPLPKITKVSSFTGSAKSQTSSNNGKEVEIYVTSWCPHCKTLEDFLREEKIPFKRYDIERNDAARIAYKRLGGTGGVPFVKIGEATKGGFSREWIMSQLK